MNIKTKFRNMAVLGISFLVLTGALIYVGNLANDRFNLIISNLLEDRNAPTPNRGIEHVKALLGESELSVKAYTLTKDEAFMERFYELIYAVMDEFEAFDQDSAQYDPEINVALDSLEEVVFRRLNLFEKIIVTGDEFRVERAMNKVNNAMSQLSDEMQSEEALLKAQEEERRRLRLFNRKRKEQQEKKPQGIDADIADSALTSFREDIASLSRTEQNREAELRSVTLEISSNGEDVSYKIDSIASSIDQIQTQQADTKEAQISFLAMQSKNAVQWSVFVAILLVLVFAIVIFFQVRSTNRFMMAARDASNRALELAEAKEEFVANVSHELRTPLNAIVGFSELLEKERNPDERAHHNNIIKNSAYHLKALVNDLLDWSKIEAGKFKLESMAFSPQELVKEVREMIHTQFRTSKVSFVVQTKLESETFRGDPVRLKQILINLLSNAFKFTDEGEVRLLFHEERQGNGQSLIKITVQDTGIGISDEKISSIFNDFEQVHVGHNKKFGGSGLGLAITKRLVKLHNGTIDVESAVGKGTKFFIELPYEQGARGQIADRAKQEPAAIDLHGVKVLIADDSPFNRKLLSTMLRSTNCHLVEAASGEEALEIYERERVDICLLDIKMPGMDGFELARRMRASNSSNSPLIVALTAAVTDDVRSKCEGAGFEVVLSKPVEQDQLFSTLAKAVRPSEGISPSVSVKRNKPRGSDFDLHTLDKIFQGDVDFRNEMLAVFIETTSDELTRLQSAVESSDHAEIEEVTHKLAPSCRHIGAQQMTADIEKLKILANDKASKDQLVAAMKDLIRDFNKAEDAIRTIIA